MQSVIERTVSMAENYYHAVEAKDIDAISAIVHNDIELITLMGTEHGKEAFLKAVTGYSQQVKSLKIRSKFGTDRTAMFAYDVDFGDPIGTIRTASLLLFTDGLIARMELFYDTKQLDK